MGNGIYQAIVKAMGEIDPIEKGKRNKEQGFMFRGIDDVMNELHGILVNNKIFIYPEVINVQRQERTTKTGGTLLYSILTIKFHFAHEDGSELSCVVVGEGMDTADKASNKAMAVGYKYACIQMFCIPTADIDDPDNETPPNSEHKNGNGNAQKPTQNGQNGSNSPQNNSEMDKVGKQIVDVLNTTNKNNVKYFNDEEFANEKNIFKHAADITSARAQYKRLSIELAKRKEESKQMENIPFGDEKEFQDDIPQ